VLSTAEVRGGQNESPVANSPPSWCNDTSAASFSSADSGTVGASTAVSAGNGQAGSPVVSRAGRVQSAGGRRTPLHFASERGELALVDR